MKENVYTQAFADAKAPKKQRNSRETKQQKIK